MLATGCRPTAFDADAALAQALHDGDQASPLSMADIAPFEWDRAVVLRPYLGPDAVEQALGFDSQISTAFYDDVLTIVFVRGDREVVSQGEISIHRFRFDGSSVSIMRNQSELDVMLDEAESYVVPAGVGERGPMCGPDGLDGC